MAINSLRLTKKQLEYVQSLLEQYRGDVDLWEFFRLERELKAAEIDQESGLPWLEVLRRNVRLQYQVTDEECEALLDVGLLSTDLRVRGVARRIAFNTPGELRTALSLEARTEWAGNIRSADNGGGNYADVWQILRALAVKDIAVARRFFDVDDGPLQGKGHRPTMLLYNAILAILTRDGQLQRDLVGPLAKQRAPAASKAILDVLGGILADDASVVAAGLAQVMSTFRRMELFDEEKIICFLAHGLAELALQKNSDLLDKFDSAQGLPWDSAFFEWVRNQPTSPVYPELAERSTLLDKWLNRLETPNWWAKGYRQWDPQGEVGDP